jgi:hypothetical protein
MTPTTLTSLFDAFLGLTNRDESKPEGEAVEPAPISNPSWWGFSQWRDVDDAEEFVLA